MPTQLPTPVRQYTLRQFNEKFNEIRNEPDVIGRPASELLAARFALNGQIPGEYSRAEIEPGTNRLEHLQNTALPYVRRDIDSIIGFTDDIPMRHNVNYYPNPNPALRLKYRIGVKHKMKINGRAIMRDPSRVPNCLFAKFNTRHALRMFFPGLCTPYDPNKNSMDRDSLMHLYDIAIRPAAEEVLCESIHDWPSTFNGAQFRDRGSSNGFSNASLLIPGDRLRQLGREIRNTVDRTDDLIWARDFFWGVEVKGVKDAYIHDMDLGQDARRHILEEALQDFIIIDDDTWYSDIGIELMDKDRALLWMSDCHAALISQLTGLDINKANSLVCNRKMYACHLNSHLMGVSGFKAYLTEANDLDAVYITAYTTDKSQTYHPERGKWGKYITPKIAMNGTPSEWCKHLLDVYQSAGQNVDVAARVEVRVPIRKGSRALREMPDWLTLSSIVSFRRRVFWDFRGLRLWSASTILAHLNQMSASMRNEPQHLALVAGLVWLINGIHSAPDNDQVWRNVQKAVLPLTMDGQADNVLAPEGDLGELLGSQQFRNGVPFAQYNVIYLLDFFIPPEADCVRFPLAVALDEQTFKKVFGSSQEEIALVAQRNNITARARHANFIPARKGLTVHRTPVRDEDHWPEFPEFVNKTVPTMGAHYGPDMADVTRPITPACTNMVSEILEYKIWGIFASSLIQKISSPKRRTESSVSTYCNIQMIDREKLKNEVMNSVELHGVFTQVHWKRASEKEWTATFNHLFPIKNWKPPRYHQHYPYMEYFLHYTALLDNVDHETAGKIREALWAKVRDLMWLPAANGERVWIYGLSDGFVGVPYPRESGPHILVNPYVHDEPSVVPPPGPPPAPEPEIGPRFLREEEEESSEEE